MALTPEQIDGLNVALDEAILIGLEVDASRRLAGATLAVLRVPEEGPIPEDPRVQIIFSPVGRVAASLRLGNWDDASAEVVPFALEQLLETVQSFGSLPFYGREFFDRHDEDFPKWSDRLSLDVELGNDGRSHSIRLFQEGADRHLDIMLWFDSLTIWDQGRYEISIERFNADGKRWWEAFREWKDPRVVEDAKSHGMYPLKP